MKERVLTMFKDNLLKYRIIAGYPKAKDFADKIGIKYSTYMGYENKNTWPTEENLKKVAEGLGVSIDTLLDYEPKEADAMQQAMGLAKSKGIKFHVPKDKQGNKMKGFIQVDSVQRKQAPPVILPDLAFQCFVFAVVEVLTPERNRLRDMLLQYDFERFGSIFLNVLRSYYWVLQKEYAENYGHGIESYAFDSPKIHELYENIPNLDEFIDRFVKLHITGEEGRVEQSYH